MSEKLYCVTDLKGSPIQTAFTDGSFCFRAEPKVASEVAQVEAKDSGKTTVLVEIVAGKTVVVRSKKDNSVVGVFNTPLSYSVRKRLAVAGKKVAVQNL